MKLRGVVSQKNKGHDWTGFNTKFYQVLNEELTSILKILFHKIEKEDCHIHHIKSELPQ